VKWKQCILFCISFAVPFPFWLLRHISTYQPNQTTSHKPKDQANQWRFTEVKVPWAVHTCVWNALLVWHGNLLTIAGALRTIKNSPSWLWALTWSPKHFCYWQHYVLFWGQEISLEELATITRFFRAHRVFYVPLTASHPTCAHARTHTKRERVRWLTDKLNTNSVLLISVTDASQQTPGPVYKNTHYNTKQIWLNFTSILYQSSVKHECTLTS
jgi:hypothetical protein